MHPALPAAQQKPYSCGPAALANALCILGLGITELEAAGACGVGKDGTGIADLKKGIRALGFFPVTRRIRQNMPKRHRALALWTSKELRAGRPCITHINGYQNESHWILLLQLYKDRAHVWDPSDGQSKMVSLANLFEAWWNAFDAVSGEAVVIALAPRKKAAKRAVALRRNLLDPPDGALPVKK